MCHQCNALIGAGSDPGGDVAEYFTRLPAPAERALGRVGRRTASCIVAPGRISAERVPRCRHTSWRTPIRRRNTMESKDLKDLTKEERVALVALIELVTEADVAMAEDETNSIDAVVDALGEEAYDQAADEFDPRFDDQMQ